MKTNPSEITLLLLLPMACDAPPMNIPDDYLYARTHEWLRLNGHVATVGLTHFIRDVLGYITHVDLAPIGTRIRQGDIVGLLEAEKAVTDIFSPISGEIIQINPFLENEPGKIHASPYDDGWLFRVRVSVVPFGLLTSIEYQASLTGRA